MFGRLKLLRGRIFMLCRSCRFLISTYTCLYVQYIHMSSRHNHPDNLLDVMTVASVRYTSCRLISRFSLRGLRALPQHHKRFTGKKAPQENFHFQIFSCVIFSHKKNTWGFLLISLLQSFWIFSIPSKRSLAPLPWHRLHFTNGLFCFIPITWRIDKKKYTAWNVSEKIWRKNMEQTSGLGWSTETFTVFMWDLLYCYHVKLCKILWTHQ